MENSHSASYAAAGVDIEAGYKGVQLMKKHVARTMIPGVVSGIGGFGGLFAPDLSGMKEPVLVSGTDGVGTKIRLAQLLDRHDTIGIDCVAMCVNDIICCGARPLFFLDYIAIGKNEPEKVASIVSGVAEGCVQSGCALIGGETAEHPGLMAPEDYDLAGFAVGVVDLNTPMDELEGKSLGEALLAPTKLYVKPVLALLEGGIDLHGASHITGGGFYENVPRMLPKGLEAFFPAATLPSLPIFDLIQKRGGIPEHDMYNTFNMGLGMVLAVPADQADKALSILHAVGETDAAVVGCVQPGDKGVSFGTISIPV